MLRSPNASCWRTFISGVLAVGLDGRSCERDANSARASGPANARNTRVRGSRSLVRTLRSRCPAPTRQGSCRRCVTFGREPRGVTPAGRLSPARGRHAVATERFVGRREAAPATPCLAAIPGIVLPAANASIRRRVEIASAAGRLPDTAERLVAARSFTRTHRRLRTGIRIQSERVRRWVTSLPGGETGSKLEPGFQRIWLHCFLLGAARRWLRVQADQTSRRRFCGAVTGAAPAVEGGVGF